MGVTINTPVSFAQRPLKPVKSSRIPNYFLFIDTETKPHILEGVRSEYFYLGWTCFLKRYAPLGKDSYEWCYHKTFTGLNRYIERTCEMYKDVLVIGHNVFFDMQASGFYQHFTEAGWKLKFYYDKGLTYILKCRKGKATITVISSTNWFDFSLQKLGEALGYPKQSIDFAECTRDELKAYCKVDVEILVKAVNVYIEFLLQHDLGRFSLTKASQAFTAFRHRFMIRKIYIHTEKEVIDLEREAYIGGRCECFEMGKISGGPFVTLDVNGMYPYVMKENLYPWKLAGYYENKQPEFFTGKLINLLIIAEIQVDTIEPVFAIKVKGKTIFPVGKFNCFVTTTGFKYGIDKGYITKIVRASVYRKADIFSWYVNYFHDLRVKFRLEENDMFLLLCKYMHNSLYGKFGQMKIVSEYEDFDNGGDYTREEVWSMISERTVTITHLMNQRLIQYQEGEGENSNVAIAAHITENARFALWDLMEKAGRDKVLYCDTDSIKIRKKDLSRVKHLIDPQTLGKLKIEDESKTLLIEGAKNYRTETHRKIRGIPHKAIEVKPGVFTFESFVRQVSHLRSGQITGAQVKTVTRTLRHEYDKGVVHKSGKVTPFQLLLPFQP